jgi:hypothetical protein
LSRRWSGAHTLRYQSEYGLSEKVQREYVAACALGQMLIIARDFEGTASAETTRQKWLEKLRGKVTQTVQTVFFSHWLGIAARAGANSILGQVWALDKVEEHTPAYFVCLCSSTTDSVTRASKAWSVATAGDLKRSSLWH